MNTGVMVPAAIAAGVIGVRAVVGNKRAPYPYEFMSWAIVYGGIAAFGTSEFGEALAWAYLVAMLTAPTFADVWKQIPIGKGVPSGKGSAAAANPPATQGLPANG